MADGATLDPNGRRYLALLRHALLNAHYEQLSARVAYAVLRGDRGEVVSPSELTAAGSDPAIRQLFAAARRSGQTVWLESGRVPGKVDYGLRNHTELAYTMIGEARLGHLQACVETIVREDIPGDLIEAGVWRGGAAMLMKACLDALGDRQRQVWLADSFAGLPPSDHPADRDFDHTPERFPVLAVSMDEVRENFRRFELLDERVRFLPGFFDESLESLPAERLAVLRIDADLHASTEAALEALYPRVSAGGYIIVDDYGELPPCRAAVDEFRRRHAISEPLNTIDESGVWWRRRGGQS